MLIDPEGNHAMSMEFRHNRSRHYSNDPESDCKLKVLADPITGKIALTGDLTGTRAVRHELQRAFTNSYKRAEWVVDAQEARVVPEGVEVWIEFVRANLSKCALIYTPSQLATILQYDDEYQHGKTTYKELE